MTRKAKLLQAESVKRFGLGWHQYNVPVTAETVARLQRIWAAYGREDIKIQTFLESIVRKYAEEHDPGEPSQPQIGHSEEEG